MPKPLRFDQDEFNYCCGVDEVGGFFHSQWEDLHTSSVGPTGTGMFISTFIDNPICKEAYEHLRSKHSLLFQSKPMANSNSGREVFLCVFAYK